MHQILPARRQRPSMDQIPPAIHDSDLADLTELYVTMIPHRPAVHNNDPAWIRPHQPHPTTNHTGFFLFGGKNNHHQQHSVEYTALRGGLRRSPALLQPQKAPQNQLRLTTPHCATVCICAIANSSICALHHTIFWGGKTDFGGKIPGPPPLQTKHIRHESDLFSCTQQ